MNSALAMLRNEYQHHYWYQKVHAANPNCQIISSIVFQSSLCNRKPTDENQSYLQTQDIK
jgi:hypothetical protein